jgi:hypothetical protein
VKKKNTRFFRRARIPGRTCLCSTTSKGGNSKSCNKGLDSSTTVAIEIVGGGETEEEGWQVEIERRVSVDL